MRVVLIILLLVSHSYAATRYVSPSGSGSTCSFASPCALRDVFTGAVTVDAGDIVLARGGNYPAGKFTLSASGSAGNPIVFKAYAGELPVIDTFDARSLAGAINDSQTSLTLNSTANLGAGITLVVDDEQIRINGSPSGNTLPVVIRGWGGTTPAAHSNGAEAVVGGNGIEITGDNVTLHGFLVRNTDPQREQASDNTQNSFRLRGATIFVTGDNVSLINNILLEGENGIFAGAGASGKVIYGNLVMLNGYLSAGNYYGHGLYLANESGTATVKHNAVLLNFNHGIKADSQTANAVGFRVQRNITAGAGVLAGASGHFPLILGAQSGISDDNEVTDNFFYTPVGIDNGSKFGFAADNGSGVLTGNYIVGAGQGIEVTRWATLTVTGNTVVIQANGVVGNTTLVSYDSSPGATVTWNNNAYIDNAPATNVFGNEDLAALRSFTQWKSDFSGFDTTSTLSTTTLTGSNSFVVPNEQETGRGWVVIYNWEGVNTVNVDLSSLGLTNGQGYSIYQAQNYLSHAPVSGTYSSPSVAFDMRTSTWGANTDVPTGWTETTPTSMLPKFGLFLVIPSTPQEGGGDPPAALTRQPSISSRSVTSPRPNTTIRSAAVGRTSP